MSNKQRERLSDKTRPIKRQQLADFEGKRLTWQVQIGRRGRMPLFCRQASVPTVLLKDVCSLPSGFYVCDHIWMIGDEWLSDFQEGDKVEFCARVYRYGNGEGYAICEPQDVKRI